MASRLLLFLGVEFFQFFIATLNFRYCAKGWVRATFITDLVLATNGFIVIKIVSEATSIYEMISYIIGAGLGSLAAMRLTKGMQSGE